VTHPAPSVPRRGRVLAFVALAGLAAAALQRMDVGAAVAALATVRVGWLVLATLCYAAILPMWALQWHLLAPRAPARRVSDMFGVVALTSSVLNTTPLLVGEATAVVLLVTRAGLDRAAAVSVLAMDQLLVGMAKLVVLSVAALAAPLPVWMTRALLSLFGVLFALGSSLVAAAWRHADVAGWVSPVLPPRGAAAVGAFASSLEPLRSASRGIPALALALLKKAVEVAAILCVQRAFGVQLPIAAAVLVLATLNLATLLPVVPGNVGVFEAAVVLSLTRMGIAPELALGIALVQHLCYFVALAAPGLVWVARDR
jgi:uncharacterized membrane protein YbhN (UPF0104 family)